MNGRLRARVLLSVLAGGVITWLMLGGPSGRLAERLSDIAATLSSADPLLVAAAFALYAASVVARGVRLSLLGNGSPGTWSAAFLTAIHAGLGHVLPLRLSDVAMIGLLKGHASIAPGRGTGMVILAKLLDVASLGLVISTAFLCGADGSVVLAALIALAAGSAGILALPALPWLASRLSGGFFDNPRVRRFVSTLGEASRIWKSDRAGFLKASGVSVAAWVLKLSMFVCLSRAVGLIEPPFWQIFFAGAVTDLIMALPIHGLFSLGTAEAGWTAGFAVLGIKGEGIVTAGFGVHILWMLSALLGVLVAAPILLGSRRSEG